MTLKNLIPYIDEWDSNGKIPSELYLKAGQDGLIANWTLFMNM